MHIKCTFKQWYYKLVELSTTFTDSVIYRLIINNFYMSNRPVLGKLDFSNLCRQNNGECVSLQFNNQSVPVIRTPGHLYIAIYLISYLSNKLSTSDVPEHQ